MSSSTKIRVATTPSSGRTEFFRSSTRSVGSPSVAGIGDCSAISSSSSAQLASSLVVLTPQRRLEAQDHGVLERLDTVLDVRRIERRLPRPDLVNVATGVHPEPAADHERQLLLGMPVRLGALPLWEADLGDLKVLTAKH